MASRNDQIPVTNQFAAKSGARFRVEKSAHIWFVSSIVRAFEQHRAAFRASINPHGDPQGFSFSLLSKSLGRGPLIGIQTAPMT